MEQQLEPPPQSFIVLVSVFFGLLSLVPGWWRFFALAAIILGIIILKSSRFTAVDKRMALAAIFLGALGIALFVLNSYSLLKSVKESIQEYSYTAEDVKKEIFYHDQRCNVGIVLRDGVYEGSDYPCSGKIFKKVSFQIYDNFIAMGDLNYDDRTDTAIVMVKQYDEEEKIIEIAGFMNSVVIGADKRQLVFNGSKELFNISTIAGLKIESGIIVLNFVVCCPTQEKVGTYVADEVYRILKPIQPKDVVCDVMGCAPCPSGLIGRDVKTPMKNKTNEVVCIEEMTRSICVKSGDKICGRGEDWCISPEDCQKPNPKDLELYPF